MKLQLSNFEGVNAILHNFVKISVEENLACTHNFVMYVLFANFTQTLPYVKIIAVYFTFTHKFVNFIISQLNSY